MRLLSIPGAALGTAQNGFMISSRSSKTEAVPASFTGAAGTYNAAGVIEASSAGPARTAAAELRLARVLLQKGRRKAISISSR